MKKRNSQEHVPWLFLTPFLVLFVFVLIVPLFYSVVISTYKNQMIGGNKFVGFANYVQLVQDGQFWEAVGRVMTFTGIQVPVMLVLAALLALAIDSGRLIGTNFVRIVAFLPYAVPAIVSTLMWGFLLGTKYGLVREFNDVFGVMVNPFAPSNTLISIGVMVTWCFTGYNMLIFYSALKSVSSELYEAAAIDGAKPLQVVRFIKLPSLYSSFGITVLFSIIGTFQLFNEPKILPSLVAGSGITNYYTPNIYAYNLAFTGSQQGYAAALAFVMAVITMAAAYFVHFKLMKREAENG